jgi:VanZ family protein
MTPAMAPRRHRSSATPLALAYTALVLYASLYPFVGWFWPPGLQASESLSLPWTSWGYTFDVWSNVLGYLPLGLLITVAARRGGWPARRAMLAGVLLPAGMSYGCEVMQQFVPGRVPSAVDWVTNVSGAAAGALLASLGESLGWIDRWHAWRQRWFMNDSAGALALLALWPAGLLLPSPVPLGLGQVAERLREWAAAALADVPWAEPVFTLLNAPPPSATPLRPLAEGLIVALGLLAPCAVAFSAMPAGLRRTALALGALLFGAAGMCLSTLLNFGPSHAAAWITPAVVPGLGLGLVLALVLVPLSPRLVAGVGLVVLTGLVVGVAHAPADPYFAQSLMAWEQGRFVRFHGLAQWVGWLWPYAAMLWLLTRLGSRSS